MATRLSYKSYLACHTLNNVGKVKGYKGFELLKSSSRSWRLRWRSTKG